MDEHRYECENPHWPQHDVGPLPTVIETIETNETNETSETNETNDTDDTKNSPPIQHHFQPDIRGQDNVEREIQNALDPDNSDGSSTAGLSDLVYHLEPEDSIYDIDAASSCVTSITESAINFKYEFGRRYHALESKYPLPNDDVEQKRQARQHLIWTALFNHRLTLCPLPDDITDVIDFGCGIGAWAIDFADAYPNCRVIGTELSPIQPEYIPPNCTFLIDDANNPFPSEWARKFDFMTTRAIGMGITNWPLFFSRVYDALKPGGWVEIKEFQVTFGSDDGTIGADSPIWQWQEAWNAGTTKLGIDVTCAKDHPKRATDAGFSRVKDLMLKIPIGPWCKGEREKLIGEMAIQDFIDNLEGISMKVFSVAGLQPERAKELCQQTLAEWMNPRVHSYMPIYMTYAQKPHDSPDRNTSYNPPTPATPATVRESSDDQKWSEAEISPSIPSWVAPSPGSTVADTTCTTPPPDVTMEGQ